MMENEQGTVSRQDSENKIDSAGVAPRPKLRDIVELYMRTRLPRDIHPSYQAINQIENQGARPGLPLTSQTEPTLRSDAQKVIEQHGRNESLEEFSHDDIYQEAASETARFASALEYYENTADPKYKTDVSLQGVNHTWEEVIDEVNLIAGQYKDKSGFWAKIRRSLRKCGENSQAFAGWLELLPSDSEYFSIICGGLKLIIKAAARLKDVRESIFDAIAKIPTLLSNTKLVQGIFGQSKELHMASSALYVSTLAALDHIVTWFRQNAAKKGLKAFLRQDGYEKVLTSKLAAVKAASDRFAKAAEICSYQKQDDIQNDIKQIQSNLQVDRLALERSRSESAQNHDKLNDAVRIEANETREAFGLELAKLESHQTTLTNELTAKVDKILKSFLSANERVNPKTGGVRAKLVSEQSLSARRARRVKMQDQALEHLDYESSVPATDIKSLLRIAWTLSKPAQDRAVTLMQSPKLHEWLKAPFSSILFVNGNFSTSERRSPLSFVCAKLMDSLQPRDRQPHVKGIHAHAFFCGQHLSPSDPDTGSAGLMRSLLSQLLVCSDHTFKLSTIEKLRKIDPSDVGGLCDIYYSLITQLPSYTTVFCLIDALSFHEDNKQRCKEALTVIQTLVDLIESPSDSQRCIFKALLTCPGASRTLYKEVTRKEDVVWMPKKLSGQGGFTSMKWTASAGRDVGELAAVNSW